jgi:hypothetical protein
MSDRIVMHALRQEVDKRYVGFHPNTSSIKPVHIAGGMFRAMLGKEWTAKGVRRLSYVSDAKGKTPKGHLLDDVKKALSDPENERADFSEISDEQFGALRNALQKLVGSDRGVFIGDMRSYTAGSYGFVVGRSIHEEAGYFIGGLFKTFCKPLAKHLATVLEAADDPISQIFSPVLDAKDDGREVAEALPHEEIAVFKKPENNAALKVFLDDFREAGVCLTGHLEQYNNALTQLRMANLLGMYFIVRYLSALESIYCDCEARPFLLDFSSGRTCISQTSELCYTQLHRSISRFYAWSFAQELVRTGWDRQSLLESDAPVYDAKKASSKDSAEGLKQIWYLAKEDARKEHNENTAMLVFGAALYDMIAMEA